MLNNAAPYDVANAIDFLLPFARQGSSQSERESINRAIQIIGQSFVQGAIPPNMVRNATKALFGLKSFDFTNKWGDIVFDVIKNATAQSCKYEIVVAIVETLLDDLNDIEIICFLLKQNDRHSAFFETLEKRGKSKDDERVVWVIRAIKKYAEDRNFLEVSNEVFELLMGMLIFGTNMACSESTQLMIGIARNNAPFLHRIDELTFLWNRVFVMMSNPDWNWKFQYDVFVILRFLGVLAAQEHETLLKLPAPKLPYPLDELPAEPYNVVAFKAVFEMENEMCRKDRSACDDYKAMGTEIRELLSKPLTAPNS